MGPQELAAGLMASYQANPTSIAIDDRARSRQWSRSAFRDAVLNYAKTFASNEPRLALVLCETTAQSLVRIIAALAANHAVLLIDGNAATDYIQRLCHLYEPDRVLSSSPVYVHGYHASNDEGIYDRIRPTDFKRHHDLSVLLTTSGSTGNPKVVRLSGSAVLSNATAIATYLDLNAGERPALALPFHYAFGLSVLTSHLIRGASLVVPRSGLMNKQFWADVRQGRCTSLSGVPYSFRVFERAGLLDDLPPHLKTMTQAGGRLDSAVGNRFHTALTKQHGRLFVMYGQTEATARMSYVPPESLPAKMATIGRPIPMGSFAVEDSAGRQVPLGHEGELVYRGPNVMMGYATGAADLALGDSCAGVLRTGDLGVMDADGFVNLTGRRNRIAKVFGIRIALDDIEAHLGAHGSTAAIAGDERIILFCEWGESASFVTRAVELGHKYGIHHSAFEFRRRQALPTNSSGKIDYGALSA